MLWRQSLTEVLRLWRTPSFFVPTLLLPIVLYTLLGGLGKASALEGGMSRQTYALASIGTSYAITYVVGLLGTIAAVSLFPKLLRLDLAAEAGRYQRSLESDSIEPLQARAYRVENPEFSRRAIGELGKELWDGVAVVRIRRGLEWLAPGRRVRPVP